MAIPQALTDAMNQIDVETNNLASVVDNLRNQVKTSMTQQEVDSVVNGLGTVAVRLKGIAADPANPVPSPAPAPAPAPVQSDNSASNNPNP